MNMTQGPAIMFASTFSKIFPAGQKGMVSKDINALVSDTDTIDKDMFKDAGVDMNLAGSGLLSGFGIVLV